MTLRADLLTIANFYGIEVPDAVARGSLLGLCDFLFRVHPARERQSFADRADRLNYVDETKPL